MLRATSSAERASPMPDPALPPIHHDEGRRFWLALDGEVAYLAYRFVDEGTVDYASTWTPHALRGRGLATRLARHALAWAGERGLTVIPSCWFVRKVIAGGR
jgi:predicted GNAT family acetyltransferase